MKEGYLPTKEDFLRARVPTGGIGSGIVRETYIMNGYELVVYDVGGLRNERKKWVHC